MNHHDADIIQFPVELVRRRASFADSVIRETRARLPEGFEALPDLEDWLRTELNQLYDKHLSNKPFSYQQEAEELGTALTEAFQSFQGGQSALRGHDQERGGARKQRLTSPKRTNALSSAPL